MAGDLEKPELVAGSEASKAAGLEANPAAAAPPKGPPGARPAYSALSVGRRRFILWIVTAAGFFGPLAGGIYLPALPTLQNAFHTSATAINATVSVFMGVLAVAVSIYPFPIAVYRISQIDPSAFIIR